MGHCFTVILVTVGLFAIFKLWLKLVVSWNKSYTCLVGKTAIVTGANTGIGYCTAMDFAKRGARVILACRNKSKAEKARATIIEATGNQNVVVKIVDLASLASVREFAKEINATEERLDILVNNAGLIEYEDITTKDGLSLSMQVNYFGPFLLTLLLIGLLKKSAPSRILNVTSISSHQARFDPDNMNAFPGGIVPYGNAKLCVILFANELARRLNGSAVDVNSVNPGFVYTEISSRLPSSTRIWLRAIGRLFFRTPEEGAQTVIYAAVSQDTKGVSGECFDNCRIAWLPPMVKTARDEGLAKKVWEKSEEFVKLSAEERQLL